MQIRYDVTENGVVIPDTEVWGTPPYGPTLNGTIDLVIDGAGNVSGSTPVDPSTGLGMLEGERIYSPDRNTWFEITGGSWGTPAGPVAPLTGGTVDLTGSFIGDFSGLTITSGFIEDGNSGDYFYLGNGVGLDGKLEFTAVGPHGVSLQFRSKGMSGYGTGTYLFGVDGGSIVYSNGTDLANVDLMGVTACYLHVDHVARTFSTTTSQPFLEDAVFHWSVLGRRIDAFAGTVDPSGSFVGAAHYMGHEFISLDFISGNGTFEDGNSAGFDASNGLVLGDPFTVVLTDVSGLFDLVIDGSLISQSPPTGVGNEGEPPSFMLMHNVPNPFNPQTRIDFSLPETGHARLTIYEVSGRKVAELVNELLQPRTHSYVWDGRDDTGRSVASGTYLYRLDAAGFSRTRKMVLMR
ncbi:MAG: hypothetical protein ACE5G2_02810 [Candidatus Krumholzibacteriia bacterium]